jgi:hypothetical protein
MYKFTIKISHISSGDNKFKLIGCCYNSTTEKQQQQRLLALEVAYINAMKHDTLVLNLPS